MQIGDVLSGLSRFGKVAQEGSQFSEERETRRPSPNEGEGSGVRPKRERTIVVRVPMCRYQGCSHEVGANGARGLCRSHYQQAWRYVEIKQKTTWEKLVREGKVLEPQSEFKDWLLS